MTARAVTVKQSNADSCLVIACGGVRRHKHSMSIARSTRYETIDVVRGVAVMGILLMNIIAFSMPANAVLTPDTWLPDSFGNRAIWALNFILIDNKMRGLFSMLYGASMLILVTRTEAAGGNGMARHFKRSFWLLIFGLVHFFLIWDGDILTLYAMTGCIAVLFHRMGAQRLIAVSLLCFISQFLLWSAAFSSTIETDRRAQLPGASVAILKKADENRQEWGATNSKEALEQIKTLRSGYTTILHDRVTNQGTMPLNLLILYFSETLGLMLLGMALVKNGLLKGAWSPGEEERLARYAFLFAVPGMALLTLYCMMRGWDPVVTLLCSILWSIPFREAMVVGYAALIVMFAKRCSRSAAVQRIAAAGKTAFTNYLGTSLVMTTLFYGYGFGLFGHVTRAQAYLFCLPTFAFMLVWPKLWLERFHQGPLEWLWRSLTEGRLMPFRRERDARPI